MVRGNWQPTEPDLEAALTDLGARIAFPPTPDLASTVGARLAAGKRPARPLAWLPAVPRRRRVTLALLAALLLAATILALSPAARASLGGWLRLRGVVIVVAPARPAPAPPPVGTRLQLGRRLTMHKAQRQVPFRILTPHLPGLGAPDEVYLGVPPPGGQVALVYRPRPGLPRAAHTGVGLLLTEFRATLDPGIFKKLVFMGTQVRFLSVNGAPAYWISGQPHLFGYIDANGQFATENMRLAGNTLLWEAGDLTLRLEGAMSEQMALRIAASVR